MREFIVFVVGLACYLPILRGGLQGQFFPASFFDGYAPLMLNACAVASAIGLYLVASRRRESLMDKQYVGVAVGCFASMGCLVSATDPGAAITAVCAPLVGLYFCYASACWGVSLTRIMRHDPWRACLAVACAYIASYLFIMPGSYVEGVAGYNYAALPAISMLFWAMHWSSDLQLFPDTATTPLLDRKTAASVIVLIGTFEVVSSFAVGIYVPFPETATSASSHTRTWLSVAVAVVLLVLIVASARFPRARFLTWGIAVVFVTAGIMLFALGFESANAAGGDILSVGRRTAWVLLFMLLPEVTSHDRGNVVKVFGCLFPLLYEATRIPINALRYVFEVEFTQEWLYFIALGISMALMLAALVWCGGITARTAVRRDEVVRSTVPPEMVRREACFRLSAKFDLTEREGAVLEQLSQGHTAKRIAEVECVAESTVRSHVKAIYRKMGCHSKQELIDRVSVEMGALSAE